MIFILPFFMFSILIQFPTVAMATLPPPTPEKCSVDLTSPVDLRLGPACRRFSHSLQQLSLTQHKMRKQYEE